MKKSLWLPVLVMWLLPVFVFAASEPYPLIQTDKDTYAYGEEVRVHFSNAPGYSGDWICIARQGSPDTDAGDYKYMSNGLVEGVMIFKSPLPGNYEVRAYYSYSPFRYTVTARYPFTVTPEEYGDIDGGYEAPITYGEPCYYPPPIAVAFAFDYFTYELSGGYVDIVFWRGGHPYHRRPWHDHGRRVTPDYIHSGQWHHKISGDDLSRHRDKLKEHNNIVHPDSYYGIKPGHQVKTGQNYQVTGEKPQSGNKQIPRVFQPRQWKRKSSQQTPKSRVWGQPSSQTEHKTGSSRGQSQDKEKHSGESSSQTNYKTDSNREASGETDNHAQSGWGGNSGGSSSSQSGGGGQSDNHGWGGNSGGGSSGSSGQSQGSSWDNHSNKKGHW